MLKSLLGSSAPFMSAFLSVPRARILTLSSDYGCINGGVNGHDVAVLTGGTWSMFNVQGLSGTQNFNDLISSFSCSPLSG